VPVADVFEATQFEVNRRPVAVVGRLKRGDNPVAAMVAPNGAKRVLSDATQLRFSGLVDLAAASTVPTGLRHPRRLVTTDMKQPALVWVTRHQEEVAPGPKDNSRRWSGTRTSETLFIFDLAAHQVLRLEIKRRSADGFGGFTLGKLVIRQQDGKTVLKTSRQDHLPARRARCLKPDAYDVVFDLVDGRFRKRPVEQPPGTCF